MLVISVKRSCMSFAKFIPKQSTSFGIIIQIFKVHFFIFFVASKSYFCIVIFSPVNLLNSLINSSTYFLYSLGFLIQTSMLPTNRDCYTFFSGICAFIYFCSLIELTRISSTTVNRTRQSRYCLLVPSIRGIYLLFFHQV